MKNLLCFAYRGRQIFPRKLFISSSVIFAVCLAALSSCVWKCEVDKFIPIDYDISSDEQVIKVNVKDPVFAISVNYWEGDWDWWESDPNNKAKHCGSSSANGIRDYSYQGEWVSASSTVDPLSCELKIDRNESSSPRSIQMYVKTAGKKNGKYTLSALGAGYEIRVHQAAGVSGGDLK